jgi:hypothetical protein
MNNIFEWGNTFVSNSPWTTYLNGVIPSFMESYWRRYYPIQIYGSWRVTDESITPYKYVVHGELLAKVLPHSNMWFMESYWRKYYRIQICGSWRVSDESVSPIELCGSRGKTFVSKSPWTTYLKKKSNGVTLSSLTLHEPHNWMG